MGKVRFAVLWMMIASALGAQSLSGTHWKVPVQGLYRIDAQGSGEATLSVVGRAAGEVARLSLAVDLKVWKGSTSLMLEPGDYQLRWQKDAAVTVQAQVQAFPPVNAASIETAPALRDGDSVRGSLVDGQSQVWSLVVPPNQTHLSLEIRGRNISQVVLWKDGVWDQGITFSTAQILTQPGRPYRFFDLDSDVEAGSYVLQVFGSPRAEWGDTAALDPLLVTREHSPLPLNGVREGRLDDEGRAEFLVQPGVTLIQAEFPEAVDASLIMNNRRLGQPSASLTAKDPVRLVQANAYASRWAVLQGSPGARFRVRALADRSNSSYMPNSDAGYLVSSAASAQENDGFPLTAVVVTRPTANGPAPSLVLDHTLVLDKDHSLHIVFDSQVESTAYVRVGTAGDYTLFEKDDRPGASEYRFELLDDLLRYNNQTQPVLARKGTTVKLQAKIYRISTSGLKLGRCEWALTPASLVAGIKASSLWNEPPMSIGPWSAVIPPLPRDQQLQLFVSRRGNVPSSLAVMALPLAAESLPALTLTPGQSLQFPLRFSEGVWGGWAETVSVDGNPFAPGGAVKVGQSAVAITSAKGGVFEAQTGPSPGAPLPELPRKIPAGQPFFENWSLGQTRVYELEVKQPGMYRWETLGRLSCELRVRTPLHRELFSARENGGGTNALLSSYLASGIYRVEVLAAEGTFGRAGLILTSDSEVIERTLVAGAQARATVPPQQFLKVNLDVAARGRYLLTSLGLNQDFTRRFEDGEGYPVGSPLQQGSAELVLESGHYTLWSYPLTATSRRAYGLEALKEEGAVENRPDRLSWNRPLNAKWTESDDRKPQLYAVSAEAPLHAQIILSEGMVWQLLAANGAILDQGPGGAPVEIKIPQGTSSVAIRSRAVDNMKDYSVELVTLDLTAGRSIVLPQTADVPLVVGRQGSYELVTWGQRELSLTLTNEDGSRVLAQGVPRTDDWNTGITIALAPGRYRAVIRGPNAVAAPQVQVQEEVSENDNSSNNEEESDAPSSDEQSDGSEDVPNPRPAPSYEAGWSPWQEARFPGDVGTAPLLMFRERTVKQADTMVGGGEPAEVWDASIATRTFTTKDAGVYRFDSDAGQLAVFRLMRGDKVLAQSPGGFLIPLPAATTYQLSSWWEDGTSRRVKLAVGPAAVATWTNPAALSGRVPENALASSAWEEPLVPAPEGWVVPKDSVWWTDGTVNAAEPTPASLGPGDSASVPLGKYGQAVKLAVPAGSVGLLKARGNGAAVGLSVQAGASSDWNWNQATISDLESVVGAGPGDYTGRVWNPAGGAVRWADLSWSIYRSTETVPGVTSGTLRPGTAAVIHLASGALRFVLDAGLIAFPLSGGARPLSAASGPTAGVMAGKEWAVVNPTDKDALWRAEPATVEDAPVVTDKTPWEQSLSQTGDWTVTVQGRPGSHVYVSVGGADQIRWGDASTGRWETPAKTALATGDWLEWPKAQGTLFLKGVSGWVRVISAATPPTSAVALGFTGAAKPLPAEGGSLAVSQQWTFRAAQEGFYAVSAAGGGLLTVWQKGVPLSSSWSADRRLVLVRVTAGEVVVGARPFEGSLAAGSVTARPLAPQIGETLLSPGEAQLWPVVVQAAGRVGLAIDSLSEEPQLWLFGPDFHVVGKGRIFWRSLAKGKYWLVVEGGEHTVRYRPVLLGLEGSRLGVPDDVQAQYQATSLNQGQSE